MTTALLITALVLFTAPLVLFLLAAVAVEIRSILDDRRTGRGVLIDQRPPATIHSLSSWSSTPTTSTAVPAMSAPTLTTHAPAAIVADADAIARLRAAWAGGQRLTVPTPPAECVFWDDEEAA